MTDVPLEAGEAAPALTVGVPGVGRQVAKSGAWSLAGQLVVLAASFVATPFTVRLLGPAGYGLLALANAAIAYVTVLDLGMGTASTRFGADAHARGDDAEEAAVVWTAVVITAIPLVIIALALWLGAGWIADHVVGGELDRGTEILAVRLSALALVARVVGVVVNTPSQVRLRWDLVVGVANGTALVQIALVPVVVALDGGVPGALWVVVLAAAAAVVLNLVVGVRLLPALRRPRPRRALARPLLRFGGALVLGNVVGLVLGNAERFLLANDRPIAAVGYYSVAANLGALLAVVPIAVCQPLLPAFARLTGAGDDLQVARLYRKALTYVLAVALPGAATLAVVGEPLLTAWAGERYGAASSGPLYVLLGGLVCNAVSFVPYNLLLARDRARTVARIHLMELPLYPCYALPLVDRLGPIGAAYAWSIRSALAALLLLVAVRVTTPGFSVIRPVGLSFVVPALLLAAPLAAVLIDAPLVFGLAGLAVGLAGYVWLLWTRVLEADDRSLVADGQARLRQALSRMDRDGGRGRQ